MTGLSLKRWLVCGNNRLMTASKKSSYCLSPIAPSKWNLLSLHKTARHSHGLSFFLSSRTVTNTKKNLSFHDFYTYRCPVWAYFAPSLSTGYIGSCPVGQPSTIYLSNWFLREENFRITCICSSGILWQPGQKYTVIVFLLHMSPKPFLRINIDNATQIFLRTSALYTSAALHTLDDNNPVY